MNRLSRRLLAPMLVLASLAPLLACTSDEGGLGGSCAPNCEARIVSQGLEPRTLAVDDKDVFWIDGKRNDNQTLRRAPRTGGDSVTLVKGVQLYDLVLDGSFVYFTDSATVKKVPKQGGDVETLASGETGAVGLALGDGQLFWATTNGLRTVGTSAGPARTIASGTYAGSNSMYRVVVDATHVYWAENGDVFRAPRAGGDPIKLRSGPGTVTDLAVSGSTLFFAMSSLTSEKGVFSVATTGGTPDVAAATDGDVYGVAIQGGQLYFSDTDGGRVVGPAGELARTTRPGRMVPSGNTLFFVDEREAAIKAIDN